ncbi:serine/threonine-protein kinase [Streptomyces sp. Ru72]|uniref:serine/threonine-protein kinase n=1 Tax=Streptomyces sp. Ru72 TaxID=2080747 RepID=UPI0021561B78|nr:serine/threonine-protein kinase [Streptomyces sp. Ru72]
MSDEGRLVAGRYRLTERIGRGGMGTVWRAEDEVLGRQVALKQLHEPPHLSPDEVTTLYERTRREARIAARVVHPNVVVVHDVVEDDGRPCIVMEYVPALTLGELLRDGRTVSPEEAARIGLGMIAALRAAHAAGVLHRDVKPGNVLLGAEGRVVLTDFGIATTAGTSTLTRTGEMVGSIDFMAPERIRGQKPGAASDLWSLGATLYQAVEGRPPFRRDTAVETAYSIAVDPLEPMKHAGALEPLIQALLFKEPGERPSAEQTERALRTALSGAPADVVPAAPAERHTGRTAAVAASSGGHERDADPTAGVASAGPTSTRSGSVERSRGRTGKVLVAVALAVASVGAAVLYATSQHASDAPDARKTRRAATATDAPSPVPEGYHQVSDERLGVSLPVPDGWRAGPRTGDEVTYTDPTGLAGITIGTVDPAGANPEAHFLDIETNTKGNYPTYRRLRMQQTTFRGEPAAVWEFTFKGRVRAFRAVDLGYGREGGREYDIYLSAPEAKWDAYRPVFDHARDGFAATGS